jgi:hypothetical protein
MVDGRVVSSDVVRDDLRYIIVASTLLLIGDTQQ